MEHDPVLVSPFSAVRLPGKNRENRASFGESVRNKRRNSLQSRLTGGEGGIRTLGTVLSR